ncbi:MAG TPA: hypothetical protein PKH17_03785 [Candidatus Syntrophosphaera sp.]|nr:hypothetical protein [Candidatus Syntrophosphaera sp.]
MTLLNVTLAVLLIVLVLWLILRKQERCFRRYEKSIAEYFLAESQDLQKYHRDLMDKMLANYCALKNALVSPEVLVEHLTNHLYPHFRNLKEAIDLLDQMGENRCEGLILKEDNIEIELADLNAKLENITKPVQKMAELQEKQVIKCGESNRNLYRKMKMSQEKLADMEKSLTEANNLLQSKEKELIVIKGSASDCLALFVDEIDFIKSWMEEKGIPLELLRKELSKYFKNNIPSEEYHQHQDEKVLKELRDKEKEKKALCN